MLLEWAKAEEEYGVPEEAIAVYRRLAEIDGQRARASEALCRLMLRAGDVDGAVEALSAVKGASDDAGQREIGLRIARLLADDLDRPGDAAATLARVLGAGPTGQEADSRLVLDAHEMIVRLLADPSAGADVADRLDQALGEAEGERARYLLTLLVGAGPSVAPMQERRAAWFCRLVELLPGEGAAFDVALRGAVEVPDCAPLWDAAERLGRALARPDAVAETYHRALSQGGIESDVAETLGLRMVAFESECATDGARLIDGLRRVLLVAPGARWALDRVKLVLGSEGRWEELFELYDRAILAASSERDRVDLLDEAALAAKDLAGDLARGTKYLETIHAIRPNDASVDASLERLYERQGKKGALIDLLSERLDGSHGYARRALRRRIASLWLDLGDVPQAVAVVDLMLGEDAVVEEMADLLERTMDQPVPARDESLRSAAALEVAARKHAVSLLRGHYEKLAKAEDVVRLAERSLVLAEDDDERAQAIRDLVRVRLAAAKGGPGMFAATILYIEKDAAGSSRLAMIGQETILVDALREFRRDGADANADAKDAVWKALHALETIFVGEGNVGRACRMLYAFRRLPFEREQRRTLVRRSALAHADLLGDSERAIVIFDELFREDAGDSVALAALDRFAALLEASGKRKELADLWEEQGRLGSALPDKKRPSSCWERAARLWEELEEWQRAVAAYQKGAELESPSSYEALARIHTVHAAWSEAAVALAWLYQNARGSARGAFAIDLANASIQLGERDRARAQLEDALGTCTEVEAVRERLIGLYREDSIDEPLARLLASEAARVPDPAQKLALLREAAELRRDKLNDAAEAARLFERAVTLSPRDTPLRFALADVLEQLERWADAAAVLAGTTGSYEDLRAPERAAVHHRRARALVCAEKPQDAVRALRAAAELAPTHPGILFDLGRAALHVKNLDLAESTYRALLLTLHHRTDDLGTAFNDRAGVFLDLADIAGQKGDSLRAADLVDSALDAAFESEASFERFETILRDRGRDDLRAQAMERRIGCAPNLAARASALLELSSLWAERLGRPSALGERLAKHAEKVGRELDQDEVIDAALWNVLRAAHVHRGDDDAALATVRRRVEVLWRVSHRAEAGQGRAWLLEAASLCREVEDDERALAIYEALFDQDPFDRQVWPAFADVSKALGKRERVAALAEATLKGLGAGADRSWMRVNLARLLLEDSARADDAATLLRAALDENPADREAADLLSDIFEVQGRFDELVTALERRLKKLGRGSDPTDQESRVDTTWRLGRALEGAGRIDDAIKRYESLLDREITDTALLPALSERLGALGSGRFGDSIEELLGRDTDVSTKRALAQKLLELRDEQGDRSAATRALELAVDVDITNAPWRDRLIRVYEENGEDARANAVLARAFEAAPEDRALLARLIELGQKCGEHEVVLGALARAIAAHPGDVAPLRLRAAALQSIGSFEAALADLESAYLLDGDAGDLILLLGRHFEQTRSLARGPDAASHAYALRLINLLTHTNRTEEARRELELFLAESPEHKDALSRKAALAAAEGNWAAAADACRALLPLAEQGGREELLPALLALAVACERTKQLKEARAALERAIELAPDNPEIMQRLERIAEASGDSDAVANLLEARALQQETAGERAKLLLRAAKVLLQGARAPTAALRLIDRVRAETPDNGDATLLWAEAHVALGQRAEALAALQTVVEQNRGKRSSLLARVYLEIGRTHLASDDIVEAFEALKAGFGVDWRNVEIAMLLGQMALDLDDDKTAERALTAVTTMPSRREGGNEGVTAKLRAIALFHLAAMAQQKGDLAKARRLAKKAATEDPSSTTVQALVQKLETGPAGSAAHALAR